MNLEDYPKEAVLSGGGRLLLRPMVEEDLSGLAGFFATVSPEEKNFVRSDDLDPFLSLPLPAAADFRKILPILALSEGDIVGVGVLHPGRFPWVSHVGSIRITVSLQWRRMGLGRILAGELFRSALHAGLEKIVAEVVEDQVDVSLFYNYLGFHTEAHLQDHFLDEKGSKHDILIMSNDLRQLWKLWVEERQSVESGQRKWIGGKKPAAQKAIKNRAVHDRFFAMDGNPAGKTGRKNYRKGEWKMGRKILVPIDLRGQSAKVFDAAKSLMKEGDQLLLLHVVSDPAHWGDAGAPHISTDKVGKELMDEARKDLDRFMARFAPGAASLVKVGIPYKEILAVAKEEKVDLIVLGKHESGALESVFSTATTKKVFLKAECDVEAVHLPDLTEEELKKERSRW